MAKPITRAEVTHNLTHTEIIPAACCPWCQRDYLNKLAKGGTNA